MLKPKEDNDKMLKTLRDIISSSPNNRTCFDCGQKGVTYVNTTIGTFVCSTCSGILRGLTPPHRIKSISMATFTPEELDFIRTHGNDECAKTWLGLWDSKRTLKQDHRDFMVDKYERKRYYLEPASPLKSINTQSSVTTPLQAQQQQQQPAMVNGTKHSIQSDNLAVLKSIQLTPPSANNRQHRTHHFHHSQNGNAAVAAPVVTENGGGHNNNNNNNNFFTNHLNGTTNGSHIGVGGNEFVADFRKASIYNSNNSLNSTGSAGGNSGHQVNGKITNGISETNGSSSSNGDLNANFADFENNKIYNAAGLPMSTSSLSNNSLNSSSNGTFTSNSSLNSTPSADRYAALKDLDEQFRESKVVTPVDQQPQQQQQQQHNHQNPSATANPINPFKNPFQQTVPMQQQQQPQQQQSYHQNWTFPDNNTQSNNFSGFGSPPLGTNGFYYTNNMTNGMITQTSPFGGKATVFGNPFMTNGAATTANTNNPFL